MSVQALILREDIAEIEETIRQVKSPHFVGMRDIVLRSLQEVLAVRQRQLRALENPGNGAA